MRRGPDYIQFYPTLRCNRSCTFCFNRTLIVGPDMGAEDCAKMFRIVKTAGVRTIDIIGGEPTIHPDIVQIVQNAASSGFHVNLSSNGSNMRCLEELVLLGSDVTIGLSINDHESLAAVSRFIEHYKPVVKAVFNPSLQEGLVHDILALEPRMFYLIYRDTLDPKDLFQSVPFHEFLSSVQGRFLRFASGTVFCSGFLPEVKTCPELSGVRCPAGTTKLGVMPDGSVYPCNLFFGREEFRIGNILADPFDVIWNHAALSFFRTFSGNRCPRKTCDLHADCHGGCPAHSLMHGGSLDAPEPRCCVSGRDKI